jgi:hypothetical protein
MWEKVAAKPPDEGYLSASAVFVEATPHPNEFAAKPA